MLSQHIASIVLMVTGAVLLIHGMKAMPVMAELPGNGFARAMNWHLVGGTASSLLGLILMTCNSGLVR